MRVAGAERQTTKGGGRAQAQKRWGDLDGRAATENKAGGWWAGRSGQRLGNIAVVLSSSWLLFDQGIETVFLSTKYSALQMH